MFVQVVQGRVKDTEGFKNQVEAWERDVRPAVQGFLGSTGGITPDGEFILLARFESEEVARANSDRPEQGAWWEETSKYVEDPMFHDCREVDLMGDGGSDAAGFVQVIQGKVTDVDKSRALDQEMQKEMAGMRPDVIGGITAWHPENGRFTSAIYFTSEAEARAKEAEASSSPDFEKYMSEMQALSDGEPKYIDLPEPWLSS